MGKVHELLLAHGRETARKMVEEPRLVDLAAEIMADESDDVSLSYAGFCMTCLPHRDTQSKTPWMRQNGKYSLMVQPGALIIDAKPVEFGIPFGSRARLILLYLSTRAMQTGERRVEIGRSMNSWLRAMNIPTNGQNYAAVLDQAKRIAACRMTFGWKGDEGQNNNVPINLIGPSAFASNEGPRDWQEEVELTQSFYEALKKHPVPLRQRAIAEIANNSFAIDVYVWLAYRLHRITRPTAVPWGFLRDQFGPDYKRMVDFRRRFLEALKLATAVYPEADIDYDGRGLLLKPSRPAVPERKIIAVGSR
jgi:hypothetical protein